MALGSVKYITLPGLDTPIKMGLAAISLKVKLENLFMMSV